MATDQRVRVLAGRYVLGPVIGQGGMGRVHRAWDDRLQRDVAVKLLPTGCGAEEDRRRRLEHEAQAAARVSHPNVVAVYDIGEDGSDLYLVMESLPGRTFEDEMAEGPVSVGRAAQVALDVLHGLDAAHRRGVLHRDIKPSNVLLTSDGTAKLGDFGIAKLTEALNLTQTGVLVGTPSYLPPERLRGEPASRAGDLYSLGVVLYEALAGASPYAGRTPVEVAHAMANAAPPPIRQVRPDVPSGLADAVDRAMSREPGERFNVAAAMAAAVEGDRALRAAPAAEVTTAMAPAPTQVFGPHVGPAAPATSPTRRRWLMLAAALVIAALVLVALAVSGDGGGTATRGSTTTTTTTTIAPPTTPPPTAATTAPTTARPVARAGPAPPGHGRHHEHHGKHGDG